MASPTTTAAATATTPASKVDPSWRLPGQRYRTYLLSDDEHNGGSQFELNAAVPITKYYQVSRRAYHQFRDSCQHVNEHNGELELSLRKWKNKNVA